MSKFEEPLVLFVGDYETFENKESDTPQSKPKLTDMQYINPKNVITDCISESTSSVVTPSALYGQLFRGVVSPYFLNRNANTKSKFEESITKKPKGPKKLDIFEKSAYVKKDDLKHYPIVPVKFSRSSKFDKVTLGYYHHKH